VFYVPGEHDVTGDRKLYLERFGKSTAGKTWQSFDWGVHFVGLNNCAQLEGLGQVGAEQLECRQGCRRSYRQYADRRLRAHSAVVVYPEWGWGTKGRAQALSILKPSALSPC
jgi:hypothetical protein